MPSLQARANLLQVSNLLTPSSYPPPRPIYHSPPSPILFSQSTPPTKTLTPQDQDFHNTLPSLSEAHKIFEVRTLSLRPNAHKHFRLYLLSSTATRPAPPTEKPCAYAATRGSPSPKPVRFRVSQKTLGFCSRRRGCLLLPHPARNWCPLE